MLVEVHSVGISFPDLLLSKGEYQMKPEPPFTLGVDFAGVVVEPGSSDLAVGQRVAGVGAGEARPSWSPTRRRSPSRCPTRCRTTRARRCR